MNALDQSAALRISSNLPPDQMDLLAIAPLREWAWNLDKSTPAKLIADLTHLAMEVEVMGLTKETSS